MNRVAVNTFTEGINKDVDKSMLSNKSYLDAQNFRMITSKGNTTGSLETIKGNNFLSDVLIEDGQFIIGSCEIRDTIILFTTSNETTTPNGGRSMIYSFSLNLETEVGTTPTILYDDSLNHDGSYLNFSTAYPIKVIGRYETPNIQKVYWTDGYNNLRYANVATHLTIDGEVYQNSGDYMTVDRFEYLPSFVASRPILKDIVGGKINTGMIAYSYQLYITNGAETAFSPLSDPIHVVSDNDYLPNTKLYKGDSESINSGKGFVLEIDNTGNIGYNRLRLVRVHYTHLNSTPEIFIVNEISININGGIVHVTDTGDNSGELTIDEFNILSTELFKCQDIATKDNKLFAANIEKSDFIVDETLDFRAVRFKSGSTATVYDGVTPLAITADLANWSSYVSDHDGVNKFNDPTHDGDSSYQWMYQADGTTLGAEGPHIKIDFETELIYLDTSNNNTTFYATSPSSSSDKSYRNYASPWKGGNLSWQRDEVYRLFVVFGNDRGQTSDPKWICDLKMPSLHDADFTNASGQTVKPSSLSAAILPTYSYGTYRLYPRIYFKDFPSNATFAQIYRVKRERSDKSVVTQGLAVPSYLDTGVYYTDQATRVLPNNGEIFKLVSPEINITKNISKQSNDYIEYVTNYSSDYITTDVRTSLSSLNMGDITKLKGNTRVAFTTNTVSTIDEAVMVQPAAYTTDKIFIDSKAFSNYAARENIDGKGSSGLVIAYANSYWSAETVGKVVVNYRANVFGSQYGGNTYEDRQLNISIPCSDIINSTDIDTWIDINYGDTFINYFDVSTILADLSAETYHDTWTETIYVPLESSINCELRHDTSQAHLFSIPVTYKDYAYYLRQEYIGEHTIDDGTESHLLTYNQIEDLYSYNTVYSQPIDIKFAISLVTDKILETEFDSMIKASNTKSNGEITDSWSKFGINEFIEVDSKYGAVNALHVFNNLLFYWQDQAFGSVSVNERSLINDKSSAQLVLGTGGVLDRFDYVSQRVGSKDKFSIVSSLVGMFWFDRLSKSIYKYSNNLLNLGKSKFIQSYLNDTIEDSTKVISHADIYNDEILFTFFKENETNGFTISFNELVDAFVSFYSFIPNIYIPYKHRYLTTTSDYYCDSDFKYNRLFLHDSDISKRCYFYALTSGDSAKYADSTLEILFNSEYDYTKVFDNLFYISNTYSDTAEIYSDTFNTLQCYNNFQNTGEVPLIHKTNLERRERGWTLSVPRNIVNADVSTNPNIFTAVDPNQLFKERMRDKYLIVYFTYNNNGVYDRFVISNMGIKYRTSYR